LTFFFTKDVQIIGLSATVSNAEMLASWLLCGLVQIDKRDVELCEEVLYVGFRPVKVQRVIISKVIAKTLNIKPTIKKQVEICI